MSLIDIRPEPMDSEQKLLRKILAALNLWNGGIVPGQSGRITIDDSGGAGEITVVPDPGGSPSVTDRVGGFTNTWFYQPPLTLTAYAAGDSLGGTSPLLSVLRSGVCTGILQSLTVYDADAQNAAIDFLIFSLDPASSTTADNGAVSIDAADLPKLLGKVSVAAGDYVATAGGPTIATLTNIGLALETTVGTGLGAGTLYVVPMVQGTPTYTAATSLAFNFGFLLD